MGGGAGGERGGIWGGGEKGYKNVGKEGTGWRKREEMG